MIIHPTWPCTYPEKQVKSEPLQIANKISKSYASLSVFQKKAITFNPNDNLFTFKRIKENSSENFEDPIGKLIIDGPAINLFAATSEYADYILSEKSSTDPLLYSGTVEVVTLTENILNYVGVFQQDLDFSKLLSNLGISKVDSYCIDGVGLLLGGTNSSILMIKSLPF